MTIRTSIPLTVGRAVTHRRCNARAVLGAAVVLCLGAQAEAVAPASAAATSASATTGPTASAASTPKLMTRDQLRECMNRRTQVRADSDQVAAQKEQVDKDQTALQAQLEALKQRAATIDRKKQADIDAYNAETAERNHDITAMDERITALNARAASVRAAQEAYAQDCVNHPYDERDRAAIEKEH